MSNNQWARYGSLAAAAAAFIGGALEQSGTGAGAVFITVGLILVGVWVTLETHFLLGDPNHHQEDTDE